LRKKNIGQESRFFLCAQEISVQEGIGEMILSKNKSEISVDEKKSQKLIIQKKSSKFQNRICRDWQKTSKLNI
jgi:hypothetical protein